MRRILAIALFAVAASMGHADAQTVNRDDILYILPYWFPFQGATDDQVKGEIANMRTRLMPVDGPYVKLGFSAYIFISMDDWNVNTSDPVAIRAALKGTIDQIDAYVTKARNNGIPISLAFQTAIRGRYDPVQTASEAEDIRSMMWYADNVLASGWWTHTRYARKQQAIQEAYVRELGKIVANYMRLYPDTLVAASGDGEQELAYARGTNCTFDCIFADYSPFAVAEFRDWIRLGGLYATGAPFAGQGYSLGSRYAGDDSPAVDTNGDGHTLNGDFGTSFTSWKLMHFDWSLSDPYQTADPHAILLATYSAPGFVKLPGQIAGGFDAPRVPKALDAGDSWWNLWVLFKQTMLQRHNIEYAKWMTTSPDPTGFTIPRERWYSNQIPADYIGFGSPENPNERWYSSMSSFWTADVSPYASFGITSFNIDFWDVPGNPIAYTLRNVAPPIAARDLRWGLTEWHPGEYPERPPDFVGGFSTKPELYRSEMAVIEQYRPSLLQPFYWDAKGPNQIQDTWFEYAMKEMVARIKDGTPPDPRLLIDAPGAGVTLAQPFTVSGWAADLGKIRGPGRGTGIDKVDVYAEAAGQPPIFLGTATYGAVRADVAAIPGFGAQFTKSGYTMKVQGLTPGPYDIVAYGHSTVTGTFSVTKRVAVNVTYPLAVSPSPLKFGATKYTDIATLLSATPAQIVTVTYGGPGTPVWTAAANQPWLQISNGPGAGQFTIGIINPANVIGPSTSLGATVTLTASNLGLTTTLPVTLTVQSAGSSAPPFGYFDTPADGATGISGSIAVTGWALDDIGLDHVELWRDLVAGETTPPYPGDGPGHGKVKIGEPLFIEGMRPDVEAAYPAYPQAYRAGWGYLMLTRGLNEGNDGTYKLYAFAYDKEGHYTTLGTKTIGVDNAHATKPFGAVDWPVPGETKSGSFLTVGWALTPNPNASDLRACTITNGNVSVIIDSGPLVPVVYGEYRPDIEGLFPGFSNASNAGGRALIDSTALSNGIHTIAWYVVDDCNRADGVGSRYFSVLNASGSTSLNTATPAPPAPASAPNVGWDPIRVQRDNDRSEWSYPNREGIRVVRVDQNERVELHLPTVDGASCDGYQVVNDQRRELPVGSSLDRRAGAFYWQPAAGFLGSYDLEFVVDEGGGGTALIRVRIVVGPPMRMAIDTPQAGSTLPASFVVAGWALDLGGKDGAGVDAVHVWAYPVDVIGAPIFVGVADLGGTRADVGATYGKQFEDTAYNLTASGLRSGTYDLVVYAHRAETSTFDAAQVVRVTVQ